MIAFCPESWLGDSLRFHLPNRLLKRIGLLGTGQRDLAVDDEERHAVHPKSCRDSPSTSLIASMPSSPFSTASACWALQASVGNHASRSV